MALIFELIAPAEAQTVSLRFDPLLKIAMTGAPLWIIMRQHPLLTTAFEHISIPQNYWYVFTMRKWVFLHACSKIDRIKSGWSRLMSISNAGRWLPKSPSLTIIRQKIMKGS
jgi:hypothetical protein